MAAILFVHAHPDDETIETGATMALYAAAGVDVCLVTCTLGEEGEVIPSALRHLAADAEDRLGPYRVGELTAACAAMGVRDHRFLGGAGRWRDSGMMGAQANDRPDCFWRADVEEAAGLLADVIREVRPEAIVTYDANGFYGHPDHIQAHRVAWRAFTACSVPRFYATAVPMSALADSLPVVAESPFTCPPTASDFGFGVPDDEVTTRVDATAATPAKLAALRAHATQVAVAPSARAFALSNGVGQALSGLEYYTRLAGPSGPIGLGGHEIALVGHDLGMAR
jgi:N-acetyl-1-D-myo-inositol-2-amino-2-deoxy-alpha-D-glucopyranoside deacetylase